MKPIFDSRVITRRFRVEWTERAETVRVYVEARRRKGGQLYWRRVWVNSPWTRRYGEHDIVSELLHFDELFATERLDAVVVDASASPLMITHDGKPGF